MLPCASGWCPIPTPTGERGDDRRYSDAIVALADDAATRFALAAAARDYAVSRDVARENAELLGRDAALAHAAQRPRSTTCAA